MSKLIHFFFKSNNAGKFFLQIPTPLYQKGPWHWNVAMVAILSLLAALEVVLLTTTGAANHGKIVTMMLCQLSIMASQFTSYHYNEVIMSTMASQITSLTIVYSPVYSGGDQRKHQSSAALAFVWGIHRWPVNSPHKGPVTRKMFPFDDVIMLTDCLHNNLVKANNEKHLA